MPGDFSGSPFFYLENTVIHYQKTLLAALLLTALPSVASAASGYNDSNENIVEQTLPDGGWNMTKARITVGLGVANSARYVGSDQQKIRLMPVLNATWGNGWFAGFPRGIGYNFSSDPRVEYGLRLGADMGRKSSASPALTGLGNISARPELGGFWHYGFSKAVRLTTDVRYGAGRDSQGASLGLGLHYLIPVDEKQGVTLAVNTTYANSHYMQSYFGVTAAQSTSSGYVIYTPGAGIREVDLSASYRYKLARQWSLLTGLTLGQLGGTVTAAPMTRSHTHNSVYVQTNYTF